MSTLQHLLLGVIAAIQSVVGFLSPGPPPVNLQSLQQAVPGVIHQSSPVTQKTTFISGADQPLPVAATQPTGNTPERAARRFLEDYDQLFGVTDHQKELMPVRVVSDELGMSHVRFQQHYQGVPIFGAEMIVHLDSALETIAANGEALPSLSVDTTSKISAERATEVATTIWHEQFGTEPEKVNPPEIFIFDPALFGQESEKATFLVWEVAVSGRDADSVPRAEYYYIDAHTGELVYQVTAIHSARNRLTYDCQGGYNCYLTYQESDNPTGSDDVSTLHRLTGVTYDYFWNNHSRDSWNNAGATIKGFARLDPNYCNAYWDDANKDKIVFSTGFVANDVVAHEFAHGVTDFSAGLIYEREAGALNESYSDIFGAAVDSQDWEMGEDITNTCAPAPLRDMSNPPRFGDPARFYDANTSRLCAQSCNSSNDYCGVHSNSGINNKAAYLMAAGGTFNGCTITGIGRQKEERTFYRALTVYLTSSSGLNANYNALRQACFDLYGAQSSDCDQVTKALQAVEMDQPGPCSGTPRQTPACAVTPSPTPTITPSPSPTPTLTPTPSSTPTPTITPTLTPTASPSPTPSPTPSPSPTPTLTPTPSPTPTPTITPTPLPSPTPSPIISLTPTPTLAPPQRYLVIKIALDGVSSNRGAQTIRLAIPELRLNPNTTAVWYSDHYELALRTDTLTAGTYDLYLTGPAHLKKKFADINIDPSQTVSLDLTSTPLPGGDANLDNQVDLQDVNLLIQGYQNPTNTFNADFNLDGQVDSADVTILSWHYMQRGDE